VAVEAAEAFYVGGGQPPRFQVFERAAPVELRALLKRRGYREDARMDVQTAPLTGLAGRAAAEWVIEEAPIPGDRWWSIYSTVEHGSIRPAEGTDVETAFRGTLLRPSDPTIFVTASRDGVTAAAGQGVAQGEWLGVQCLATLPKHRRLGAARTLMAALGHLGQDRR
jgi:ribosomal protein S18 acetylase RimI-like enzyme